MSNKKHVPFYYDQDHSYPALSISIYSELIKSKQTFLLVYTAVFAYLISAWTIDGIIISEMLWVTIGLFLAVSGSTLLKILSPIIL